MTLFWTSAVITLLCCLFVNLNNQSSSDVEALNITPFLKVEPRFIYFSNEKYHAKVSGQLRVDIKIASFYHQLSQFDTVIIDGLDIDTNSTISINWQQEDEIKQFPLKINSQSINTINILPEPTADIGELYILIESNFELGTNPLAYKEVSFNAIYLDHSSNQNIISYKVGEWFDFTPIKFNSINGYSNTHNLHFKDLIQRIIIWLGICILFYALLQVPAKHLISCLAIAWFITLVPFSYNIINQHEQISTAFKDNDQFLNKQDMSAYDMAQSIKSKIEADNTLDAANHRFIIIGPNTFYYLRLYHYLMEFNIAINTGFSTLVKSNLNESLILILADELYYLCERVESSDVYQEKVKIISNENNYCLVKTL